MAKVIVGPSHLVTLQGGFRTTLTQAGFDLVFPPKPVQMTESDLLSQLDGVGAALAGSEPYTNAVFKKHPSLKVVARAGVGYDAIDVKAATEHGVVVTIAPGTNQDAVAEHTFMLILAFAKNLIPARTSRSKRANGRAIPACRSGAAHSAYWGLAASAKQSRFAAVRSA